MSRADIRDVGEVLDRSEAALVVVVASSHASEVRVRMSGAEEVTEREVQASGADIEDALGEISGAEG